MLDHSNSQGPHESDVNKNILLTLQKYSKYLYFSKLICQQLICQQLFLRGAQKLSKVRSWHFLIFSTAINQNKEIELDHVDSGLKINRYAFFILLLIFVSDIGVDGADVAISLSTFFEIINGTGFDLFI